MNKSILFALLAFCFFVVQCNTKEQSAATTSEEGSNIKKSKASSGGFEETDNPNVRIKTKFPAELKGVENMLGTWTYTDETGRKHEETWSVKANGLPEGNAQETASGKTIFEENFSIEIKDKNVVLWIKPQEQDPVPYTLKFQNGRKWLWHNADHDFPQVVEYELVGDNQLKVKAMGSENNSPKTIEFTMDKQG